MNGVRVGRTDQSMSVNCMRYNFYKGVGIGGALNVASNIATSSTTASTSTNSGALTVAGGFKHFFVLIQA